MPRLVIRADVHEVIDALRLLNNDVAKDLTAMEKRVLEPALVSFRGAIHRKSGRLAGAARIGTQRGHAWVGYGDGAPPWVYVQEYGGSVPAPYSAHAKNRAGSLMKAAFTMQYARRRPGQITRRIRIKPWIGGETSYWLYPAFREHESAMAESLETQVMAKAKAHGF
jgi:hypothetical protein